MIKRIKQILIVSFMALLAISLAGCSKNADKVQTENYSLNDVEKMEIKTNANEIILRTTESDNLIITFKGGDGELASLEDGLLSIDLYKTFAGVTMKKLEPLYIDIPKEGLSVVSIKSDAGNVAIDTVNIADLSVDTEVGDIIVTGVAGSINAISSVGSIETDLPYASEILVGKDGLGNTLVTDINNPDGESSNTILYTNTGKIILR